MTTLDHAVEEEYIHILLEEDEEVEEYNRSVFPSEKEAEV
jgi:hypothetical protein